MGLAITQLKITGTHMYYITDEVFASKKPTEQSCIRLLIHRIEFRIQICNSSFTQNFL